MRIDCLCGDDGRLHKVNVTEIDGGENRGRHAAGWSKNIVIQQVMDEKRGE
jgi:hypothetical protein